MAFEDYVPSDYIKTLDQLEYVANRCHSEMVDIICKKKSILKACQAKEEYIHHLIEAEKHFYAAFYEIHKAFEVEKEHPEMSR